MSKKKKLVKSLENVLYFLNRTKGQCYKNDKNKENGKKIKNKKISLVEWQSTTANKKLELFPEVFNMFKKKFLLLHMQSSH